MSLVVLPIPVQLVVLPVSLQVVLSKVQHLMVPLQFNSMVQILILQVL